MALLFLARNKIHTEGIWTAFFASAAELSLKRELSSAGDSYRLTYARRETFWYRRNVFVGTANPKDFLSDPTSVCRFWIWETTKGLLEPIDTDRLATRHWAIWGEAYQVYRDKR